MEVSPTFKTAVVLWWAIFWRSFLLAVLVGFIAGFGIGIGAATFGLAPDTAIFWSQFVSYAAGLFASVFVIRYLMINGFGRYRLMLKHK